MGVHNSWAYIVTHHFDDGFVVARQMQCSFFLQSKYGAKLIYCKIARKQKWCKNNFLAKEWHEIKIY